jgi:urease accessory protein
VLRALGERVEPLMHLLRAVRGAWREPLLGVPSADPRVWST